MYDELGVRYEAVTEELPDLGLALRYEYVPAKALGPHRSRTARHHAARQRQRPAHSGESSGWVEVAAKHTVMLTSIEWQGRKAQDTTFAAIGEAGTMLSSIVCWRNTRRSIPAASISPASPPAQ